MKYLPTLDLWNSGINAALRSGQLKLQRGQWIRCGQEKPSRFVCVRPGGTIWAAHPEGAELNTGRRFRSLCAAAPTT